MDFVVGDMSLTCACLARDDAVIAYDGNDRTLGRPGRAALGAL